MDALAGAGSMSIQIVTWDQVQNAQFLTLFGCQDSKSLK